MVCSASILPSHCRGRRRHAALSVAALIACIGLVGSVPHRHHHRHPHERQRVDEGWEPKSEDPAFTLSIEDRVSIIFMCTDGKEACDVGMARIALTALRTTGQWRGETVMVTDMPQHFKGMQGVRVHVVPPMKHLNHIDAVSRRQTLVYNTDVTDRPFVLNIDADIVVERPIVELLTKYPTLFRGIAGFGDHGFTHQINCGFLVVRIRAPDPVFDRCLASWKNMTATRNPGLNWDMEQQSLYITAQTDPECPTEQLHCRNCYQPRSQFFSKYTAWRPYLAHYSNTLRLAASWPAVRGVIGRRYLACDGSTAHPAEIAICHAPCTVTAIVVLYREEMILVALAALLRVLWHCRRGAICRRHCTRHGVCAPRTPDRKLLD